MALNRYRSRVIACLGTLCLCLLMHLPSIAQTPLPSPSSALPTQQQPFQFKSFTNPLVSQWIWLDGRSLFRLAAEGHLTERIKTVQDKLDAIQQGYLNTKDIELQVEVKTINNLPVIYINNEYLLTITALDTDLHTVEPSTLVAEITSTLKTSLQKSRAERQPGYLRQQGQIVAMIIGITLFCSVLLYFWQRRLGYSVKADSVSADATLRLPPARLWDGLQSLLGQVLSILQVSIWSFSVLLCLDRFPDTRPIKAGVLNTLSVPFTIALVGLGTYLMIRLSWAIVNRFALALAVSPFLTPIVSRRLQLRISTIAKVTKGILLPIWISTGVIVTLILFKVDVGPLLAGVGLVGVAISLASQSIIKDVINGFLVILEDQFGVGDVIQVGQYAGAVETLNLRITQIRNSEGQLITIPNSEIKIVANLSSEWSRVDLDIPVPYHANLDQMLMLIQSTAVSLSEDPDWQPHILETPQLMGVDDFDERGLIVKIWVKTQPLQQWAVSRELRRRLKLAFDDASVEIPVSQHSLWMHRE
ncbi:MAG: mechanosensitive ion channel [Acaryochloridaceae cyanobacterium SU_2_1]|nr:mechanosensitive ion channel [Acaryochloridaceae cyanobacterium SU_2_1]